MAAVSARKMVSPSEAASQPCSSKPASSSSAHPPSGPTPSATSTASAPKGSRTVVRGGDRPEFKTDALGSDLSNGSQPYSARSRYVELIADARPQYAHKMLRIASDKECIVTNHFIGDPAAAGHAHESIRWRFLAP